jgi:hypothetical protein
MQREETVQSKANLLGYQLKMPLKYTNQNEGNHMANVYCTCKGNNGRRSQQSRLPRFLKLGHGPLKYVVALSAWPGRDEGVCQFAEARFSDWKIAQ